MGLRTLALRSESDLASKPLVGMVAAVVFVISCMPIPVPLAGTCSHPCGTGLAAVLLGPTLGVVAAAVALLIQALFLSHGGLTTWGANLFSMGVMGSFAGYAAFRGLRLAGLGLVAAAFGAGLVADWATYAGTAMIMAAGIRGASPFWPLAAKIALAFVPTQLPLGIVEGAITAGMVSLLRKKRPDLLARTALSGIEEDGR
jgi:cobalt/nickel transport system permease protein